MPTIKELDDAHQELTLAVGYMTLAGGGVEYMTQLIAISLLESIGDDKAARTMEAHPYQYSRLRETVKDLAGSSLEEPLRQDLVEVIGKCRPLMEERNTFVHSIWVQSVFSETAHGDQVTLRGLRQKKTTVEQIIELGAALNTCAEELDQLYGRVLIEAL